MKRIFLLFKIAFFLTLVNGIISCNSEDRHIKRALKDYALENGTKYKLIEYRIVETILKSNIEDSIKSCKVSIQVQMHMMQMDSSLLKKYISEREHCKSLKQNTMRHLRSDYDILIDDWQEMIDEEVVKLNEKQSEINMLVEKINKWESLIENANSTVIYYVINHKYTLDEKHIEENILLTSEFEVL